MPRLTPKRIIGAAFGGQRATQGRGRGGRVAFRRSVHERQGEGTHAHQDQSVATAHARPRGGRGARARDTRAHAGELGADREQRARAGRGHRARPCRARGKGAAGLIGRRLRGAARDRRARQEGLRGGQRPVATVLTSRHAGLLEPLRGRRAGRRERPRQPGLLAPPSGRGGHRRQPARRRQPHRGTERLAPRVQPLRLRLVLRRREDLGRPDAAVLAVRAARRPHRGRLQRPERDLRFQGQRVRHWRHL